MIRKNGKNSIVKRVKNGRFSLTYFQCESELYEDTQSLNDSNYRIQNQMKVCIQYGRFNRQTGTWDNQQIWCSPEELRDLLSLFDDPEPKMSS